MNGKGKIYYLLVILISIPFLLISCDLQGKREIETKKQEAKQKIQQEQKKIRTIMMDLIERHNPILFPPKNLSQQKIFTYNLQKVLIHESKKPVLFIGELEDITKNGNDFIVHFNCRFSQEFFDRRRIRLHLKCRYEDVNFLIENPPKYDATDFIMGNIFGGNFFFVISKIIDVQKIRNYTVEGRTIKDSEDVELEIQSPDIFSVTGELVEIVEAGPVWVTPMLNEENK